jgi:hypothetical protein
VSYNLYRGTTANFTPSAANRIATQTGTTFSDTGRVASTTYFYVVEAATTAGVSASVRTSATTPGGGGSCAVAPAAVTNLAASASSTSQINVAWNAVTPPANCTVTYTVHRSTTANFTPSASTAVASGLTTTAHSSTGLAPSTTYHFVVLAVDAVGSSTIVRTSATTQGTGTNPGTCHVGYTVVNSWPGGFQVALSVQNTGTAAFNGWTLTWTFPSGQTINSLWNGAATQTGATVTVNNLGYNAAIAPGASYNDMGFTANGAVGTPASFSINGTTCN